MTERCIIFYIFDDLNRLIDRYYLNSNSIDKPIKEECCDIKKYDRKKKFLAIFYLDGYFLSVFSRLLETSEVYSKLVIKNLLNIVNSPHSDSDVDIKVKLVKPKLEILDYAWNSRVCEMIIEKQQLESAMSWLSTLGGAFSALGDSFENCAKVAGQISIQQFKIAFRLGEPPLIARCKLYMALSFIQLGKFSNAKKIVEDQYKIAKDFKDIRLQNMCKGIWAKLQYIIKEKKKNSLKNIS